MFNNRSKKKVYLTDGLLELCKQVNLNVLINARCSAETKAIATRYLQLITDKFDPIEANFKKIQANDAAQSFEKYWQNQWLDIRDICWQEQQLMKKAEESKPSEGNPLWLMNKLVDLFTIASSHHVEESKGKVIEKETYVPPLIPPAKKS